MISVLVAGGHVGVARLPDRAIYNELAFQGLSLFDLNDQASEALRQDWRPLLRFIEQADI